MRKWISESDSASIKTFVIQEEYEVGFYLYVFTGDKCTNDYLQDTFDQAVEQAEEDFGVSRQAWELVSQSPPNAGAGTATKSGCKHRSVTPPADGGGVWLIADPTNAPRKHRAVARAGVIRG